ncbi:hypothetical protein [Meiothermus sp. CFH 77666]|uniref:hypothetical protein n=1 Tax=Meiothermus sp. CFH 77666 TaxID=2817942 RepID=UPI001AA04965|nr:hypothetical protein [Meiothermus sp. CFH 77666]MBO1438202.1 hypothetical protein [Meiothermus sp. CFH 77666]
MAWIRPWRVVGGGATLVALAVGGSLWMQSKNSPESITTDTQKPYRTYTATGQVMNVKAQGTSGCTVLVKLHQWISLSDGFALAEMPQKGQIYTVGANPEQCMALEVALASLGDPEDLKSPRHIYYEAGQLRSGEWHMTRNPSAPLGCGGL